MSFFATAGIVGLSLMGLVALPKAVKNAPGASGDDWSGIYLRGDTVEGKSFYSVGETITFRLRLDGKVAPEGRWFVRWIRTGDDGKVEEGHAPLAKDGAVEVKTSLAKPGFVRLEAFVTDAERRDVAVSGLPRGKLFFDGGAGVEPEKLGPPPEPADFDAWWKSLRDGLATVAMNPRLREYPSGREDVRLYSFELDSPGGICTGWLAVPKAPGQYPLRVKFFGYNESWEPRATDVRKPSEMSGRELRVWVSPHGIELAREKSYYADLRRKLGGRFDGHAWDPLENANPDTSYFKQMAWRVLTGLAYAKTRSEWDRRTLIVTGGSQGGLQSAWAASQDPAVTKAEISIVWNCDAWGKAKEGRLIGDWALPWAEGLRYFDAVTHATRIPPNCRVTIGYAGLGDYISPPSGLSAFYNALRGPKSITWVQGGEHSWRPPWPNPQKTTWACEGVKDSGWEPTVKRSLDALVMRHRGDSGAYAVFDFDYTLALGDSSYVCLWRILENRDFRGGDMVKLMGEGLSDDLRARVRDLFAATNGVETAKLFWPLYRHIWNSRGDGFACEWRSRLFAGYATSDRIDLARAAMRADSKRVGHRPDVNVPSEKRGFVILPEVIRLVHDLQTAGIAVYVVSGSRTELLKVATGDEFGFDIPPDHVFGCDSGVVAGEKTAFIRTRLAPRHSGREPVLVAGDSMGDYGMFTELPEVENILIFRRANARAADAPLRALIESAPGSKGRVLVQGRDEPRGLLVPSHESIFTSSR